ncbi:MAG TPA: hypothetical protein VH092_01270 [Urbifossiella sp.]|nr:hypothetical protein [Urbifossiella sp.]
MWALGVILYECLTGGRPFGAADQFALLRRVVEDDPTRPGKVVALPRDVELICLKCLAKAPADRYPTAAALSDDLIRFLADLSIRARPPSAADSARRLVRRHPLPAALAAGLVLTVVIGLVVTATLYFQAARARDEAGENATRADNQSARADQKAALAERTVEELLLALGNNLIDTTDVPRVRLGMYLRALALYDPFAADPGGPTPAVTAKRAETRAQIAALRNGLGQIDEARADYEEAIRLFRSLGDEGGNPRMEAATVESYAAFLHKTGRPRTRSRCSKASRTGWRRRPNRPRRTRKSRRTGSGWRGRSARCWRRLGS